MTTTTPTPLSHWFDRDRDPAAMRGQAAEQTPTESGNAYSYECRGVGCKSSYCRQCGFAKGQKLRRQLIESEWKWQSCKPVMVTLTLNPELFDGPREGLDHVRKTGAISKFVKRLRRYMASGLYFAVIEYHVSGWPHWHMMLDADYIPYNAIRDAWHALGPKGREWTHNPHGIVDVRSPKKFRSKQHRFNYLCKYVTKVPKQGFPDWLLDAPDLIFKRYTSSHGLFSCNKPAEEAKKCGKVEEYERTADTIRGRLSLCGAKTAIMKRVEYVTIDGEIKHQTRCVAKVPIAVSVFAEREGLELVHGRAAITGALAARWQRQTQWAERLGKKKDKARAKHDAEHPLFAGQYDGS